MIRTLNNCTPRMPKMIKNVQQMSTMLPMGLSDDMSVCTTSLTPGARLITRSGRSARSSLPSNLVYH